MGISHWPRRREEVKGVGSSGSVRKQKRERKKVVQKGGYSSSNPF